MFSSQEAAFVINSPPRLNDRHGCCTSLPLLQDSNTTEDANDRNVHVCFSLGFSGFLSCQVVPPTVQTEQVESFYTRNVTQELLKLLKLRTSTQPE